MYDEVVGSKNKTVFNILQTDVSTKAIQHKKENKFLIGEVYIGPRNVKNECKGTKTKKAATPHFQGKLPL